MVGSHLRIFARQDEIRTRLTDFAPGWRYSVRAMMLLDVGAGGQSVRWRDVFIESVFPLRECAQEASKDIHFEPLRQFELRNSTRSVRRRRGQQVGELFELIDFEIRHHAKIKPRSCPTNYVIALLIR